MQSDEHHRDVHRDVQVDQQIVVTNEDVPCENHRDPQVKQHRDVSEEIQQHTLFVDLVHREVHMQLTKFLDAGNTDSFTTWQPYVVSYFAELVTMCLQDCLTIGEDFVTLLTRFLGSTVYDIRLASLRFLVGVFEGDISNKIDAYDDDDDDGDTEGNDAGSSTYPLDASSQSAAETSERLSRLLADADSGLLQVLVDMLLYREMHDECLLMVSKCLLGSWIPPICR